MFKIQQLAWQREAPGSLDTAYWQGQGGSTPHAPSTSRTVPIR